MSAAPEYEPQNMGALLAALTQPDTNTIRQAEQAMKPLLKDPRCIPALMLILHRDPNNAAVVAVATPPVRHIAAVVLRKRLTGHYANLDPNYKTHLKAEILQILAHESERSVRNGMVGVAAAIAKLECTAGGTSWPELFNFLAAAAANENPMARELAFSLLSEMTETVYTHLKEQFQSIAGLFQAAFANPNESPAVQKAAVQALGQLLSFLADDAEVQVFAYLIPAILQVASRHAHDDEDLVAVVLDVLYDLAYSPVPAITQHLTPMVTFCLEAMKSSELEMRVRDSAALVVATLAEAKPKTFGKEQALLAQVLEVLFTLIENSPESAAGALFDSNPMWREDLLAEQGGTMDDPDDPYDNPTETSMAQGTLDMLACEIPKKYILEPLLSRCMSRIAVPDPNKRKAGIACLGVVAEGCAEPLRDHLADIMPQVLGAARDENAQVRECACFCLGQISEHCQPEILGYSEQILPTIFSLLDDTTVAVQATSCYVLEMFCERLEPQAVRPMLDSLVRKLAAMLEGTTKRSVQEMAVAAMAATAVAAEEEFTPYVAGVASLMQKLMVLQEERLFSLRGRALECMGHMAIAVGRDTFRPYFTATMQCACEGLTTNSTDLQEFAYAVFANLAKVMKEEFAPALGDLVPHLIEVIGTDEGQLEPAEEAEKVGALAGLDDSDEEDEEGGNYVLHVRTALLEVKKGAITAIGEMTAHTGAAFVPFLEEVMQVLQKAASNWHPLIKCEVADALPSLVMPCIAAYHEGDLKWTKGDVAGPNPMSQPTQAIVAAVLTELIMLMKDDDKSTVGKSCEGIQSVIEVCGPHALLPVANDCLTNTYELLSKTAPCLAAEEMYGEFPEDDDDHDVVMQAACDLVGGYGRVMGAQFAQYLPQFLPAICNYAKSSRPPSDRSMAVGCLSELAQELEGAIAEHWKGVFLPAVIAGLADADENVKRNAAFCAGVCCEHLKDQVAGDYPQILQGLSPLFSINVSGGPLPEGTAACVDNAAAAVARMIMASPNNVPMAQVLPAMLAILPLKTDMTENETVYKCLGGLLEMNHPEILSRKAEVKRIFTEAVAADSKVEDEIKAKLTQMIPSL
ncbi:Importin subunit beta-4 [Seminavis robusta]|uniref:Importin subunit beta-4 n=1 Tax=Seminavis robusta TaxID=568900 RepID=A0A9N8H1D9_9STRA|nr:Importin subunit beta-4 [Seminavis robusta]|eukprot:Sro15_g011250.1 Importin subunit beta-4 (1087) ;mRNA; r:109659-113116